MTIKSVAHVCIKTTDLDATRDFYCGALGMTKLFDFMRKALRQHLVERGYTPREIMMGADNSYQFWMKDPNGMDLEFHEYTDKSSQITGQAVEVNW